MYSRLIREKAEVYGIGRLDDAELLGYVLRSGTMTDNEARSVAGQLLEEFGDLRSIGLESARDLAGSEGMTEERAYRVLAATELARRYNTNPLRKGSQIRSSGEVYEHFHERLRDLRKEHFYSIMLDGKNHLIAEEHVSEGSLTNAVVHPREVYRPAIRMAADAIICVHNHPSGDPTPSVEDVDITQRLVETGQLVGIRMLDHIIIGDGTYVSMHERGMVDA